MLSCFNLSFSSKHYPLTSFLTLFQNTIILKRRKEPPLYRKGSKPPKFRGRHYIYDVVEDTNARKRPPLTMILTKYVEGLGERGDKITMAPFRAYDRLLLPGLAVYDTPENNTKYVDDEAIKIASQHSSPFAPRTISVMRHMIVNITMSNDTPWTLERWHVRAAFRKCGVHLSDHCITMPNHEINGPNHDLENREFYVIVTLNNTEKTPVRCRIHHHSNDVHDKKNIPVNIDFYKHMAEPIFPEDKAVLDTLPVPFLVQREMNRDKGNEEDEL